MTTDNDNNATLDELYATIDAIYRANGKEPLTDSACVVTTPSTFTKSIFNLMKPIQQHIDTLRPTVVLTQYEEVILSEDDVQSVKPVPDLTITDLLVLFAGKGTTPCVLDGALLAHTADGTYIKILPEIDKKDGYANYKFTAINYKALNFLIEKYCELLQATSQYEALLGYQRDAGEKFFGIEPVYDYNGNDEVDTEDEDDDADAYTLKTLNKMLKSRMQSSQRHLSLISLSERLASQISLYAEDRELLEYLRVTVNRVYKDLGIKYYIPYTPYFDPPYRISGHYLSAWIYYPEEYNNKINHPPVDAQGNIIKHTVDHIIQGIEYRSDNRPNNLQIVTADYNAGRTSRSTKVRYSGRDFISLFVYNKETNAGSYGTLLNLKDSLQPGESKEYNNRIYTKVDKHQLTVTDNESKVVQITYDGKTYATPKAFADEVKIGYKSLHNALSGARKAGKSEFERKFNNKKYRFYLDKNGNITNIV